MQRRGGGRLFGEGDGGERLLAASESEKLPRLLLWLSSVGSGAAWRNLHTLSIHSTDGADHTRQQPRPKSRKAQVTLLLELLLGPLDNAYSKLAPVSPTKRASSIKLSQVEVKWERRLATAAALLPSG